MKKLAYITVLLILLSAVCIPSYGQDNTLPKIWSQRTIGKTNQSSTVSDYKYIPAPQVTKYVKVKNSEAIVYPNFRPWPTTNTTQSEMSIDIHPLNGNIIFGSANTTNWPVSTLYGTGGYITVDGTNWTGFDNPPYGANSGDPASMIGTNGYFYEGFIDGGANDGGQGVARSTDNGATWTRYIAGNKPPGSLDLLDKNHLVIDKKVGSPYENRLYVAWTAFVTGSPNDANVELRYSSDNGVTWSPITNISAGVNAGSHDQGINLSTGPNGEVYAVWAVYDNWGTGVYGEDAIGFTKSTDGGATWQTPQRIYSAANFGIRGNLTSKASIRVSSFPSMAVDRSGGPNNGYIYIAWPQKNVAPAGSDPDIVMIRSTDGGSTWSAPVRLNDDPLNNAKDQYYNWVTVDQSTGHVFTAFYDSRNTRNDSAQVYLARSIDGGLTHENILVSDSRFKPKPISGLASGYQGDYIGVAALNNNIYPFWADDRTGNYQGWMTKVSFGPTIAHTPLGNTENLNGPYVVNAVFESALPLNPNKLYVYWGRGSGNITDSVLMTSSGGNSYTANIPGNGSPAVYNYYIYAEDNSGGYNTYPSGAPSNYVSFEAATDNTAPVITHSELGNQFRETWPALVTAAVSDNIGVDSVWVIFKVNSSGTQQQFGLLYSSAEANFSGLFSNNVSTVAVGDTMYYRIVAKDASAANNLGYYPGQNTYSSFVFVNDTEFPVVQHTPLRDQAIIKWPALTRAVVTDNLGVESVTCEYSVNNGAITGSFPLILTSGQWVGSFNLDTNQVHVGDSIAYRLAAEDISNLGNITYSPASGYNTFKIVSARGLVLVVNDDVTIEGRYSNEKTGSPDLLTPLGASSTLFGTVLNAAGYVVDSTTFAAMDTSTFASYDVIILSAGTKVADMFIDQQKRAAVVRYTLNGGKTLVEGGEVGYKFRRSSATSDLDPYFRRNVLHDSSWVSDYSNGNLMPILPNHTIFKQPNSLTGPFGVSNFSGSSYASRDVVRIMPGQPGVVKAAGWVGGTSNYADTAGIIIYYQHADTNAARNIFFTFAVSQFTDQLTAAKLIENAVDLLNNSYLSIPVELASFSASASEESVTLSWTTATELNNSGFDIERKTEGSSFGKIGFVKGKGTTTELSSYSFTDNQIATGSYTYRLKQIDFDGKVSYSNPVNVTVSVPLVFALEQNYPNPFNPATTINFSLPEEGIVSLKIYNLLGEKVADLIGGNMKAGRYEVKFDASKFASGIYFYRLEAGKNISVKKMMLLK